MLRLLSAVGLQLVWITAVSAQANVFNVEGSFFGGSLGYVRSVADNLYVGVEIGAGVPQFDQTLRPEQDAAGSPDFKEIAHVALLVRFARSEHVELDAGVRSAIADLWPCLASDCWPHGFWGVYLQPMVGWRRFKVGPRLVVGRSHDNAYHGDGSPTGVVALTPLAVRLTISW